MNQGVYLIKPANTIDCMYVRVRFEIFSLCNFPLQLSRSPRVSGLTSIKPSQKMMMNHNLPHFNLLLTSGTYDILYLGIGLRNNIK